MQTIDPVATGGLPDAGILGGGWVWVPEIRSGDQ